MPLHLYNTLTRRKEAFAPIDPSNVRMYVCGPTVYDFAHIGNARPVIVFDVLYRLLRHIYGPDHVTYVRNITDVDDKINARALRDHPDLPLNEAIRKVTERTADQFFSDVEKLGCERPDHQPRATEHIEDMKKIIQLLLDKGNAYIAVGSEGLEVLFSVSSMPQYGLLSHRSLSEQQAGARVEVEPHKRNPADFVLWKQSAPDQPGWHAEFKPDAAFPANDDLVTIYGRPGWHIECSAMSSHYLGEVFDIHGGGLDLIFPHHENEIAQSRCAFETKVMANVWMHNGFLQVEGQKMSKSLGNFLTINELLTDSKIGPLPGVVLRLAMLGTHYREPIDWTYAKIKEARAKLSHWNNSIVNNWEEIETTYGRNVLWNSSPRVSPALIDALLDDINTPLVISRMSELYSGSALHKIESLRTLFDDMRFLGLLNEHSLYFSSAVVGGGLPESLASQALALGADYRIARANNNVSSATLIVQKISELDCKLVDSDFTLVSVDYIGGDTNEETAEELLELRQLARARKDWTESDSLRARIEAMGWTVVDSKDGMSRLEPKS